MDLLPTSEQQQMLDAVTAVLEEEMPLVDGRPRRLTPALWRQAVELGWIGLGIPDAVGGLGGTVVEQALIHRAIGRYCGPAEFLFAVLGAQVAVTLAPADVPAMIAGERRTGILLERPQGEPSVALAAADGDALLGFAAPGTITFAPAGGVLDGAADCLDPAVPARRLQAAPSTALFTSDPDLVAHLLILVAATEAGMAGAALDLACAHARTREQFGKPIGSFQAVRHACAEMSVRHEAVNAQLVYAAASLAAGHRAALFEARALRSLSAPAALHSVRAAIQVFGAIGITDEHPLHLLLKRCHLLDALFGGRRATLDALLVTDFPDA